MIMNMVGGESNNEPDILLITQDLPRYTSSFGTVTISNPIKLMFDITSVDSSTYKSNMSRTYLNPVTETYNVMKYGSSDSIWNYIAISGSSTTVYPVKNQNKNFISFETSTYISNDVYTNNKYTGVSINASSGGGKSSAADMNNILFNNLLCMWTHFISTVPSSVRLKVFLTPTTVSGGMTYDSQSTPIPLSNLEFDIDGVEITNVNFDCSALMSYLETRKSTEDSKFWLSTTSAAGYGTIVQPECYYYIDEVKPL